MFTAYRGRFRRDRLPLPSGCKRKVRYRRGRRVNLRLRLGERRWRRLADRNVRVRAVVGVIGRKRLLELCPVSHAVIVLSDFCMQMHVAHLHGEQRETRNDESG